ncbi:MAG: ATPase [Nitrospiria bacterium]
MSDSNLVEPDWKKTCLEKVIDELAGCVVACSGGIDSMLLATIAHRVLKNKCRIVHSVSPAVPVEATERAIDFSKKEGWSLDIIETDEFSDEAYLSNPVNRCFYCKSHLYKGLSLIAKKLSSETTINYPLLSGTNDDDLSEYRPGLSAARDYHVRHPFVEAAMGKADIRALCRSLGLSFADLPSSPCLASRLYTGTRVTAERLSTVHFAEESLKRTTGISVVRCRLQKNDMRVEILRQDRHRITEDVIAKLRAELQQHHTNIAGVALDSNDYMPGRSFKVGT